jgi:hypothetical protein
MPVVLGIPKLLALENMPQMASAVIAHNLRPHHAQARIRPLSDRARYGIPEGGPSTTRVELVVCFVERGVAGRAAVDAGGGGVLVEFARAGHFGAFLAEDAELFCKVLVDATRKATAMVMGSRTW